MTRTPHHRVLLLHIATFSSYSDVSSCWCCSDVIRTLTFHLQPPPTTPTSTRLSGIEPNSIYCRTMQYRFSVQHLQHQCHTIDRSEELKARIKNNNYMEDKSRKYIPPTTTWIHIKDNNGLKISGDCATSLQCSCCSQCQ